MSREPILLLLLGQGGGFAAVFKHQGLQLITQDNELVFVKHPVVVLVGLLLVKISLSLPNLLTEKRVISIWPDFWGSFSLAMVHWIILCWASGDSL